MLPHRARSRLPRALASTGQLILKVGARTVARTPHLSPDFESKFAEAREANEAALDALQMPQRNATGARSRSGVLLGDFSGLSDDEWDLLGNANFRTGECVPLIPLPL